MRQSRIGKGISRLAAGLLCLALLLSVGTATVHAYTRIDTGRETSLTVQFTGDGKGISGASFRLYRVADVSDAVTFSLSGDFAGAAVDLEKMESSGDWADMALTLQGYAGANEITPLKTAATGADGKVTFSGLSVGLYLLVGDTMVVGDYAYAPAASLLMLPTLQDDDSWDYGPTAEVKATKSFVPTQQDVTVKKVWNDGGYVKRPTKVTVQLLKDGKVEKTVVLSEGNNWTYIWKDLDSSYMTAEGKKVYTYTVNETDMPRKYTVTITQKDSVFTISNYHHSSPDDKTTPGTTPGAKGNTLPQTGMLYWPIPVLTISGLLLIGLGWYLQNSKKERE